MKRIQNRYGRLAIALVCALVANGARTGDLAIQSFEGTGRLTFNTLNNATNYRVEWASSPGGPWTNFTGAATRLDAIFQPPISGIVTCSVPMCYRVVAEVTNAVPAGMVLIPAGNFVMGATTNMGHESNDGETPQHAVYVNAFYMDRTEVTWTNWCKVATWAATNNYTIGYAAGKATNHPAQYMEWYSAVKWCNARSHKEGLTPCYTNANGSVCTNGTFAGGCNWSANGYPYSEGNVVGFRTVRSAGQ